MGLKQEVLAKRKAVQPKKTIDRILEKLSKEDKEELVEMLQDETFTGVEIADVLTSRGFSISERGVQRYRRDLLKQREG